MSASFSTQSSARWAEAGSDRLGSASASTPSPGRTLMGVMFGVSLTLAVLLYAFQPIENGQSYQLGVRVTALLALIWYVTTFRGYWLAQRRFLGLVFLAGLYVSVQRPLSIRPNSEIIAAYGSAFAALDAGENPYTSGSVIHHDQHGRDKLGNFNYPPVELIPYHAVSKLIGRWDHRVLTGTLLVLQLVACGLLLCTFPGTARVTLAFVPLFTCFELHTNVALTLLGVAVAVYLCLRSGQESRGGGWAMWAWFGVALLTKFLVIPLFATFALRVVSFRSLRAFVASAAGPCLALAVAVLLMLPFGIGNVLRETLLFNLVLSDRAALTTFYPNVLSGTLSWLGVPGIFPVLAVLLLGAAVLYSRHLPLLPAMSFTGSVFLLVSPTPEPQYIPVMLYLAVCALLQQARVAGAASAPSEAALQTASERQGGAAG